MPLPRREKEEAARPDVWPESQYVPSEVDGDCDTCGQQVYVGDLIVARKSELVHEVCEAGDA